MDDLAIGYEFGTGHLPEPWEQRGIVIARDNMLAFVSVSDVCDILGPNADTQVDQVQRAAAGMAGWELEPEQIRTINMPPKAGAAPRAGWREKVCIDIHAVGWWLTHVNASKVKPQYRQHLRDFQRAVQVAADRLWWQHRLAAPALPAPRLPVDTASCCHDGQCPHCQGWVRVQREDGKTEWRRLA